MSDPTAPPTPGDVEKPRGLNKYMKRLSTVLKRNKSGRGSVPTVAPVGSTNTGTEVTAAPSSSTAAPISTTAADIAPKDAPGTVAKDPLTELSSTRLNSRNQSRQERARALFAKYGLTLEDDEWVSSPREPAERVEKAIRMRVRRQCHRCQKTFGADRICSNCQHTRCRKCPRYPPRKSKPGKQTNLPATRDEAVGGSSALGITDRVEDTEKRGIQVNTATPRTGQDLVHKGITQRIRYICHECSTAFVRDATECRLCHHTRCEKCSREPAKHGKHTDTGADEGPEIDRPVRQWKKVRVRVRWTCHECSTLFLQGTKTCSNCNHERCEMCIRQPPKKIRPPIDPDVVKSVEEKLARLRSGDDGSQPAVS